MRSQKRTSLLSQNRDDGMPPPKDEVNEGRLVLAYSSRSTLTLRAQGLGLPELRKQLDEEDEVLFGFLRFRRRGIVLQYTNPDCSRVVKGPSTPLPPKSPWLTCCSSSTGSFTDDFEFLSR